MEDSCLDATDHTWRAENERKSSTGIGVKRRLKTQRGSMLHSTSAQYGFLRINT